MQVYSVILFPEVIERFPHTLSELVEISTTPSGERVAYLTVASFSMNYGLFDLDVVAIPYGDHRRVLLHQSFVAVILELVNQQNQVGFVSSTESL